MNVYLPVTVATLAKPRVFAKHGSPLVRDDAGLISGFVDPLAITLSLSPLALHGSPMPRVPDGRPEFLDTSSSFLESATRFSSFSGPASSCTFTPIFGIRRIYELCKEKMVESSQKSLRIPIRRRYRREPLNPRGTSARGVGSGALGTKIVSNFVLNAIYGF